MSGKKVKALRREVYGNSSHRDRKYIINKQTGQIRGIGKRQKYQEAKGGLHSNIIKKEGKMKDKPDKSDEAKETGHLKDEHKVSGGNGDEEDQKPANSKDLNIPFKLVIHAAYTPKGVHVNRVEGFPDNYDNALALMVNFDSIKIQVGNIINRFYVLQGQMGNLDENLSIKVKRILEPDGIKVPAFIPPGNITKH